MSMLSKLKQYKDLRHQAKTLQSTLSHESVEVTEAGGKFKLAMDGNMQITKVEIDSTMLVPQNKKEVENAVKEGVQNAIKKIQRIMAGKMKEMGGLKLPDM